MENAPESAVVRWLRRCVTIPALLTVTLLETALLPWLLLIAAVLDVVRAQGARLTRFVLALTVNLWMHTIGLGMLATTWLLGAGPLGEGSAWRRSLDLAIQRAWARWTWQSARRVYAMKLSLQGSEVLEPGPFLFFPRHTSLLDTILPLVVLGDARGKVLRYTMKRELLWDPCVDVIGHRLPTAFVQRGTQDHARDVARVAALLDDLGEQDVVVLFPEGTRFTALKRRRVLASLERKHPERLAYANSLHHVLPPHHGGPLALLARGGLDVVFCAHTGLEGAGAFGDLMVGAMLGATVRARFWRVPAAEIPTEPGEQRAWLDAWWTTVDRWIDEHRESSGERVVRDRVVPSPDGVASGVGAKRQRTALVSAAGSQRIDVTDSPSPTAAPLISKP